MIKLKNKQVNDYLEWNKILIGIDSALLGAMFLRFAETEFIGLMNKTAAGVFFISLLALLAYIAGLLIIRIVKAVVSPTKSSFRCI
jgi:heme O synthase-like polyprenyltransferase